MIYNQLLSLIRQKKLFVPSSPNNKTLINLIDDIDNKFTTIIQEIKWTKNDESIIKFLYLVREDIQKDPTIIHNVEFLKIIISKYDFLFESAYNEKNSKIREDLLKFLQDWYRSETEGSDV